MSEYGLTGFGTEISHDVALMVLYIAKKANIFFFIYLFLYNYMYNNRITQWTKKKQNYKNLPPPMIY